MSTTNNSLGLRQVNFDTATIEEMVGITNKNMELLDELAYSLLNGRTIDGGNLGDEDLKYIYDGGEL